MHAMLETHHPVMRVHVPVDDAVSSVEVVPGRGRPTHLARLVSHLDLRLVTGAAGSTSGALAAWHLSGPMVSVRPGGAMASGRSTKWRRGWDSNPRGFRPAVFKAPPDVYRCLFVLSPRLAAGSRGVRLPALRPLLRPRAATSHAPHAVPVWAGSSGSGVEGGTAGERLATGTYARLMPTFQDEGPHGTCVRPCQRRSLHRGRH